MRDTIRDLLPDGSVLIQLVNEHFYPAPDDDDNLKKAELLETLSCTTAGAGDRICFRYIRGPIVKGCDFIGTSRADFGWTSLQTTYSSDMVFLTTPGEGFDFLIHS